MNRRTGRAKGRLLPALGAGLLAVAGLLGLAVVSGAAMPGASPGATGPGGAPSRPSERVSLLFTVNNLGYTDTCG